MKSIRTILLLVLGCCLSLHFPATAAESGPAASVDSDRILYRFDEAASLSAVKASDARFERVRHGGATVLRVTTGQAKPWPGVTLPALSGPWDLSNFSRVLVRLRNAGTNRLSVNCRVDNSGADGTDHCVNGTIALEPGRDGELSVELRRTSGNTRRGELFGMRGYPAALGGKGTVDPSRIVQVLLFVNQPRASHQFEIVDIRASGVYEPPLAWVTDADPYLPFIDTFGQYRHKDWPGKVHSLTELKQRRADEARELAAQPGPADWDPYGGWAAGPQLKATGYFRTEQWAGRWWLVDPVGHLFWSHGLDCVRALDRTPVEERSAWFEAFPGAEPGFAEFVAPHGAVLMGHFAGQSPRCFSFAGANLKRKYGDAWKEALPALIHRRLRSWGMNTIGNWSDSGVRFLGRTPYTASLDSGPAPRLEGSEGYWGKFPDPFDPGFRLALQRSLAGREKQSTVDPWCIGFFSDNELAWGNETSLALAALRSPATQAAKKAFVKVLQEKYGDVAKLNAAWGSNYPSWDSLLALRQAPDRDRARVDLEEFYARLAEQYFSVVREVITAGAPHHLYLGCRFAWGNARAAAAAAKHCDVVSYNLYQRSIADFQFNGGRNVPLLVGEFHFGALDRGLFHPGLVLVPNQAARAAAYRHYLEGALRHPQIVGTHWFQYQDEPVTGRAHDEENYQIGFVDVADTPYAETINASRAVAAGLYPMRAAP